MSKYLIKLKPLGKYFFGGDMTFEVSDKSHKEYNSKYSSYIIESNKFPQQTSLLGMMRYLLLTKSPTVFSLNENRITDKEDAAKIIGQESFSVTKEHELASFGKIASIGPCFLLHEDCKNHKLADESFLSAPKDYQLMISFNDSIEAYYNENQLRVPAIKYKYEKDLPNGTKEIKMEEYSSKAEFDTIYINGNGSTIKEDDIFIKDIRIGINKSYEGKTSHDDKGYYKQISYRLKDGFSFAFVAEVDFDLSNIQNEIISLGADGSKFSLSVSLLSDEFPIPPRYPDGMTFGGGACRVILLSDSLLDPEDVKKACFTISESIPFRFLKTNVACENYNVLAGKVQRSAEKYYLYEKGSVFYFENERSADDFVKLVVSKEEFHQIGYNYCEKK